MPIRLLTAPRLEPLAERLAERMAADPLPPLAPEVVVIAQNTGLRAWLENHLAHRLGCAASLRLVSPRGLAVDLANTVVPRPTVSDREGRPIPRDPFEREGLQWRIAALLPQLPKRHPYTELHAYAEQAGPEGPRLLAARLARLYDDYQVYRPDVLAAWTRGETTPDDHSHASWQAPLWRHLDRETSASNRAAHLEALIDALRARRDPPDRCPSRVTVFGALIFPPLYLRVLDALALHTDVEFLAVLPGGTDSPPQNPLRIALAEREREFVDLMSTLPSTPEPLSLRVESGRPHTALAVLQADVREDTRRGEQTPGSIPRVKLDPSDFSVRIHDAHAPLREIEVLRDQLLDAFEALPDLRPDDVLVLVPDLETYAPVIDAVFGADYDGVRIPYHVVGHPHAPARRVLDTLVRLLALPTTRCSATDLADLLQEPVVRRAAGLSADALDTVRDWTARSHIHWGRDGQHKADFGLPEDDLHTWLHGLDRLMLGFAVGDETLTVGAHVPLAGVQDEDTLGRFAEWAARLFAHADIWSVPRPLDAWPPVLNGALADLAEPLEEEEHEAIRFLREQIAELAHLHHLAADRGTVPFDDILAAISEASDRFEADERTLTGRTTVADPLTLRYAPHRVIAFVGLNDGTFPRQHDEDPLDLIALTPRVGDPRPRRTERQLFLDAILAARDRLLLSYVGRSERDNSPRAASPVLEAFLQTCNATFEALDGRPAAEHLMVRHRLQPFSHAYFSGDHELFTYAHHHRIVQDEAAPTTPPPFCSDTIPETQPLPTSMAASELVEAWSHPSRYFCRRRLGLRLEGPDEPLQNDEPLNPDGLAAFRLREQILAGIHRGLEDGALADHLRATGALPPGALGSAWFERLRAEIKPLVAHLSAHPDGAPREIELAASTPLTARLPHVTDSVNLLLRCAKVKDRSRPLIEAWVLHLTLLAAEPQTSRPTLLVGTDHAYRFDPVLEPAEQLDILLRGWRSIREAPPPLFAHASQRFAREAAVGKPDAMALQRAAGDFDNAYVPDDAHDPYVQLCFRSRDPLSHADFGRWARALWLPILRAAQDA